MKYIASISGGKDSTAMTIIMVNSGYPLDEVIFCDTTMEFDEIYRNLEKLDRWLYERRGIHINYIKPKHSFEYYLTEYIPVGGHRKGMKGYGFPSLFSRWCTGLLKTIPFNQHVKSEVGENSFVLYLGYSGNEVNRTLNKHKKIKNSIERYPLIEHNITSQEALQICYENGFDFDGLYNKFDRVSCWCCPFKNLRELYILYSEYPEKWRRIRGWERVTGTRFRLDYTTEELEERFKKGIIYKRR